MGLSIVKVIRCQNGEQLNSTISPLKFHLYSETSGFSWMSSILNKWRVPHFTYSLKLTTLVCICLSFSQRKLAKDICTNLTTDGPSSGYNKPRLARAWLWLPVRQNRPGDCGTCPRCPSEPGADAGSCSLLHADGRFQFWEFFSPSGLFFLWSLPGGFHPTPKSRPFASGRIQALKCCQCKSCCSCGTAGSQPAEGEARPGWTPLDAPGFGEHFPPWWWSLLSLSTSFAAPVYKVMIPNFWCAPLTFSQIHYHKL